MNDLVSSMNDLLRGFKKTRAFMREKKKVVCDASQLSCMKNAAREK